MLENEKVENYKQALRVRASERERESKEEIMRDE